MSDSTEPKSTKAANLHKYITKNSEYLFAGDLCLEVRGRGSASSKAGHGAVRQRLRALVRWLPDGGHQVLRGRLPEVGDCMLFGEGGRELLTSVVHRIESYASDTERGQLAAAVG